MSETMHDDDRTYPAKALTRALELFHHHGLECRPPPEQEGKPYHWLKSFTGVTYVYQWTSNDGEGGTVDPHWLIHGSQERIPPALLQITGLSYLGPAEWKGGADV